MIMTRKQDIPEEDNSNTTYELDINEHVQWVDPAEFGVTDFPVVKPTDYFITSGDAVVKAAHLDRDVWQLAGEARKKFSQSKNKKHAEFQRRLWEMAGKCRALLNILKKARGEAIFLETEWRDHKLYCIPKNPRKKDVMD